MWSSYSAEPMLCYMSAELQEGRVSQDWAEGHFPGWMEFGQIWTSGFWASMKGAFEQERIWTKPKINSSSYIHQRNEITGQTTVPKIEKTNRELQLNHPIRGPEARNSVETSRNLIKCGQGPTSRKKERGWSRQLNWWGCKWRVKIRKLIQKNWILKGGDGMVLKWCNLMFFFVEDTMYSTLSVTPYMGC